MEWDKIRQEYETSELTLKLLAEKYCIKLGTLKSRKSREGWSRDATTKKVASKKEKVASSKKVATVYVENEDLTERQRLFCLYYVKIFNATQSAIKAGYSPDTAHVIGHENLRKPKIADEIRRLKGNMTQDVFVDAVDVLQKWIKIAFADITDFLTFGQKEVPVIGAFGPLKDDKGQPLTEIINYIDIKESNQVDGSILSEVKQGRDGISIKLADKMKALEKLSAYFDLFPDNFKRQIEEERLKLEHHKIFGSDQLEEYEDDGFEDALKGVTEEVWADDDSDESED
jgi:phage terminase small subunit